MTQDKRGKGSVIRPSEWYLGQNEREVRNWEGGNSLSKVKQTEENAKVFLVNTMQRILIKLLIWNRKDADLETENKTDYSEEIFSCLYAVSNSTPGSSSSDHLAPWVRSTE